MYPQPRIQVCIHAPSPKIPVLTLDSLSTFREKKSLLVTNAIEPAFLFARRSQTKANMCWLKTSLVGSRQRFIS